MDKKEAIQCIRRLKYEIDCKHALMQKTASSVNSTKPEREGGVHQTTK